MDREEAKAQHPGQPKDLVIEAAWPWIVDAIYDKGLAIGPLPTEVWPDGYPAYIVTTTEKP